MAVPCCSQFDKFGEPYCYHVEQLSIRDLEKHYHLTSQTRKMWGIPRAASGGSAKAAGDPWSEAPDPYIPETMTIEEVRFCVCSTVTSLRIAALMVLQMVGLRVTRVPESSVPSSRVPRRCRS